MSNILKTKSGQLVMLPTEEEDKAVEAAAMADPDALLLTDAQLAEMQPIRIFGSFEIQPSSGNFQGNHETQYLLSVPSMRESIKDGMDEPIDDCNKDLDW